jgi:hypothetical protein
MRRINKVILAGMMANLSTHQDRVNAGLLAFLRS